VPLPAIKEIPSTRVVIVRDVQGRTLGRGRVTRERLKNMLPRRIVLPW
jgi:NOL1/NOP2/fmu family ribosome biogenesis protein